MSSCSSVSPVLARSARRWEHRSGGGRFRAEIEMDRGIAFPRSPELGFAAAVREPLVRLQRPRYDFERWDWGYFAWPHDRLDANLEMRDNDPLATFEADRKVVEGFLSRSIQQLEASQSTPQLEALEEFPSPRTPQPEAVQAFLGQSTLKLEIDDDVPPRFSSPWRQGCAESNPFLLEHCKALQGHCAY
uniref:Uncharacterized protein n=1 Tax=Avena sativa TaxID=4498 RepID=A0ACD5TME7_AVESA